MLSGEARNLRVLIVEDEAIVAADLESLLSSMGYHITGVADTGRDALALATARPPDVALVDIRLHGDMDGVELAHHLRAELRVPVVFATAHADVDTVQRASTTEPFGYVVKPFDEQSLRIAIEVGCSRHAAEEKLRHLERWLATTLHSLGDAVIATDSAGRINLMNAKAETLTGWSRAEALGRPLDAVFALSLPAEPQLAGRILAQAVERGAVFHLHGEAWLRTRTGALLPIDDSIAPIRDEQGLVTGLVAVFRDRSALLAAEEQRQQLEQKMHEAQRLESLGVLAGGIAHDFNNLLMVTFGNATLCRTKLPADSDLQPYLESIEQAARRGADLCTQMLAYAGKGQFVVRPVDLSQLVRNTVQLLQVSVDKGAELMLDLAGDLPPIMGDASKLQQVVMNLVINASEALCEGRGTISVRTSAVELDAGSAAQLEPFDAVQAGRYVLLEVRDTGHGMDADAKRRIFDPFFSTKFQGRGLGLAAVRGILGSHGGGASVESAPGQGTLFKVFLPSCQGSSEATTELSDRGAPPLRAGGRALVVDDEASVRWMASALMRELGFEVDALADGEAAVSAVQRDPTRYRVALLDLTMPKAGGVEAARHIRRLAPGVPLLLMSGYDEDDTRSTLGLEHVSGFLSKPFALAELREKLAEVLESADARG